MKSIVEKIEDKCSLQELLTLFSVAFIFAEFVFLIFFGN